MNILGLSAFFHESACCLLRDGRLMAAAEEERFSRVKHDPRLPVAAFRYCLRQGGIGLQDLDAVAYYESPVDKLSRQLWAGVPDGGNRPRVARSRRAGAGDPRRAGLRGAGPHLRAPRSPTPPAPSSSPASPKPPSSRWTAWASGPPPPTAARPDVAIERFEEVEFPHSLGLLYSTLTSYLGFEVNDGEYKVMGLAPYGEPRYLEEMRKLVSTRDGGQYRLDLRYFDFLRGRRMYSDALPRPLRRAAPASRVGDHPLPPGRGPQPPGGAGGDPAGEGPLAPRAHRPAGPLHGRRRGPQRGGQRPHPAGGPLRAPVRPAGGRRLRRLPRRRRPGPRRADRPAARRRRPAARLPGAGLDRGRDRRAPARRGPAGAGLPGPRGRAAGSGRGPARRRQGRRLVPRPHGAGPPRAGSAQPARRSRAIPGCATG